MRDNSHLSCIKGVACTLNAHAVVVDVLLRRSIRTSLVHNQWKSGVLILILHVHINIQLMCKLAVRVGRDICGAVLHGR